MDNLTSLAFLPWAHIFGMTAELHTMVSTGSRLAIVPHRDQILQCLLIAKPNVILSVPVLFNKVRAHRQTMFRCSCCCVILYFSFQYLVGL